MTVLTSNFHRCNARCYDAISPTHKCKCVCSGKNHGIGLSEAWNNYNHQGMFAFLPRIEKKRYKK